MADFVGCDFCRGRKDRLSQRSPEPRLLILELFLRYCDFAWAYGQRASR